jgi:hypothetical protein
MMYWRVVIILWVSLAVIATPVILLNAFAQGLCDTTCPSDSWLRPLLFALLGVGVVGTVFVWFLRRWNQDESWDGQRDQDSDD